MPDTAPSALVEGIARRPYPRYPELKDAVVFVTGGGSGIGAYLVYAFAAQGAKVAFVSLEPGPAEALCAETQARTGNRPLFLRCDIRDLAQLQAAMNTAGQQLGAITVLINNAARDDRHSVTGLSAADWEQSLNTNLRPYFFTAQAAVPAMRQAGQGCIINLGSNSANLGLAGYTSYVTAKAAIVGMSRALARELGGDGIRVNTLIPGWVMTKRQQETWVTKEALAQCLAEQCLKQTIEGEDIAGAALFLASDSARMLTGQSIIVDGGRAMT